MKYPLSRGGEKQMQTVVRPVTMGSDLKKFIMLPWKIYKDDKCWVPPLINDVKTSLDPAKNPALEKTVRAMFLAEQNGKPVGRIYTGIDTNINAKKNISMAFFSMFECIRDYDAAEALFDAATDWARQNGADFMTGPCAVTGVDGDENKGLLVDCFDKPPVLMNSYNPSYYKDFIERYGFVKDYDVFAYSMEKAAIFQKDPTKVIEYAKKRYGFRVDTLNLKNIDEEVKALKYVMDKAMPSEWPDLVPPTLDEVRDTANKLISLADPALVPIARCGDEPIGFCLALPDYNEVLIRLNGRMTPLSALKFLWYRRRIKGIRVFAMFVTPEFRNKGVSFAIYHTVFTNALNRGYVIGEASTIGETNLRMRADIESTGAVRYKTYRIYRKELYYKRKENR
jgi:GNAT superfamily N-acetyltransferase